MKEKIKEQGPSLFALSPLILFICLYLGLSIILNDFYKVPITVAFLVASIYAIATTKGKLEERITIFSRGAGKPNMMLMLWIFILAGAFANTAKQMGAIDATVELTLRILPENLLLCGLFLAACFISISIGTSVGTIVALTPVAVGIAERTGSLLPLVVGVVVGGAYFGDNLSFISDTTIIATKSMGCQLKDKFRLNIRIVTPAAILAFILYIFLGQGINSEVVHSDMNWVKVLPYLVVLLSAAIGVEVMVVLTLGIVIAGVIGMACGEFDFFGWFGAMSEGILSMSELIIITIMAGGLMEIIRHNGGIAYIIEKLTKKVSGKRGAEMSIAGLVTITDFCTANNTVALITVGEMARQIADRFGVDKRKAASILDTFSCFAQSIIPYGAQMLMAAGLAKISPITITPYLFYPFFMVIFATLSIAFKYPRRFS